jgi:hypothetical protein
LATVLLVIASAGISVLLSDIRSGWQVVLEVGAGTGGVYLLRWYWWRINAWSEIAAMISSFVISVGFFIAGREGWAVPAHIVLLVTVATTTVVWVAATFLTRPTDHERLVDFYRLVRPAGPGWRRVRQSAGLAPSPDSIPTMLLGWVLGIFFIYSALFGAGSFLYGQVAQGTVWLVVFVVTGVGLVRILSRMWGRTPA